MAEIPRGDMLPDSPPVVETPPVLDPVPPRDPVSPDPDPTKPPKGFVPYQALNEERDKRQTEASLRQKAEDDLAAARDRIAALEGGIDPEDIPSGELHGLRDTVSTLSKRLETFERGEQMRGVFATFPELAAHQTDFESFLATKPNYSLADAAQLFIVEKGIVVSNDKTPRRKGVEQPSKGPRAPIKTGYSPEEIDDLRMNHPRKFIAEIRSGKINPDDIA